MQPFALHQVRLLPGPYQQAQQQYGWRLLAHTPDRLLQGLRAQAGRPVRGGPARAVAEARAEAWQPGPYLSACAAMWAATGSPAFRQRVWHLVAALEPSLRALAQADALAGAAALLRGLPAGLRDAQQHAQAAAAPALLALLPADAAEPAAPATDDDPARYGERVYRHDERTLQVEHCIASVLHWPAMGLRLRQLPHAGGRGGARLLVQAAERRRLGVRLRHPGGGAALLSVNGRACAEGHEAGGHVEVERSWRRGDVISLELAAPVVARRAH